jgi:hypothetical protein
MNDYLQFSSITHGKLFPDFFPDVRLHNPEKFHKGHELEILLKGNSMGFAKVVSVRVFQFNQLGELLSFLNIGKPQQYYAATLKKYYGEMEPNQLLDHVLFQWTRRNVEMQAREIMNWWTAIYQDESHIHPKPIDHHD